MTAPEAKSPAACAEFPNDNRTLHRGSIWRCADPCEPATVDLGAARPQEPTGLAEDAGEFAAEDDWADDIEIVDELSFEDQVFDEVVAAADGPACHDVDPFEALVERIEEVARASGGAVAARGARWLLTGSEERADGVECLPPAAIDALRAAKHVHAGEDAVRRGDALRRSVSAWRDILRGDSEDFSTCGGSTLDEWAADLVARVIGDPAQAGRLRHDLRRRGVAAFGLVSEAV